MATVAKILEESAYPVGLRLRNIGEILGIWKTSIKSEWEKLEAFAYVYIWWWCR